MNKVIETMMNHRTRRSFVKGNELPKRTFRSNYWMF